MRHITVLGGDPDLAPPADLAEPRPLFVWMAADHTQAAVMSDSEAPHYRFVERHEADSRHQHAYLTCTCKRWVEGRKWCRHMTRYMQEGGVL